MIKESMQYAELAVHFGINHETFRVAISKIDRFPGSFSINLKKGKFYNVSDVMQFVDQSGGIDKFKLIVKKAFSDSKKQASGKKCKCGAVILAKARMCRPCAYKNRKPSYEHPNPYDKGAINVAALPFFPSSIYQVIT
jgi:hypothetical protein